MVSRCICVSVFVKESNISSCFETLDMVVSHVVCVCLFACVMVKLSFVQDVFRCEKQAVSMLRMCLVCVYVCECNTLIMSLMSADKVERSYLISSQGHRSLSLSSSL